MRHDCEDKGHRNAPPSGVQGWIQNSHKGGFFSSGMRPLFNEQKGRSFEPKEPPLDPLLGVNL